MASAEQIFHETKGIHIYHTYSISATVHATVHATPQCLMTIIQVKEYYYNKPRGLQKPK